VPTRPGQEIKIKVDGKEITTHPGVFISRWTFVIGKDGKVIYKNTQVKASEAAKQVLEALDKQGK
jgi:peroxiredoxin Q/BCP